jgi:hypothetical protein
MAEDNFYNVTNFVNTRYKKSVDMFYVKISGSYSPNHNLK